MKQVEYQASYRQRQAAKGLVQFSTWIPAAALPQMRLIAEALRRGEPIPTLKNSPERG